MADDQKPTVQRVIVTDFDMPIGSMVGLLIKWAIAAIPAAFIIVVLWAVAVGIMSALIR